MKVQIEKGSVKIDIAAMLDEMTADEKRELADALSLQDAIIEDVASQIVEGWTELSSHAADDSEKADPFYPLAKAIRKVALGADAVHERQVEKLVRSLKWCEAQRERVEGWAWKMYHLMNDLHRMGASCPYPPQSPEIRETNPEDYIVVKREDRTSNPESTGRTPRNAP